MPTNSSIPVINTAFNSTIELSALNSANGFTINGIATADGSGMSVASAGDVNGDGVADIIIGASNADPAGKSLAGQSYVVFGQQSGWNSYLQLSSLNGVNGFVINGINVGDMSGYSVASAGDINGDGLQDMIIGAASASPTGRFGAGQSYVIFGRRSWTPLLELSNLNGTNGFMINGILARDNSGWSVTSAGDINGDGLPDIIIGAYSASPSGKNYIGQSYVIFGKRNSWASPLELSSLNGANGFIINGIVAGDQSGWSVASAGDVNGDGLQDMIIGANTAWPGGRYKAGQTYVIFGKRSWASSLALSSLNGTNGVIINGIAAYDSSGNSVASAGDFNGDGLSDILIGARDANPAGKTGAGQSYVVFGTRSWTSPLELSALNGANGFIVNGIAASDESGCSVASAGDINGDGLFDIIIGAYYANPAGKTGAGQSYVVFGTRSWTSPLELSALNGTNGFIVNGISAGDHSGNSVASANDVNGDGLQDMIMGAYGADPAGKSQAGQSYVVFGDISIPIINNQLSISAGQSITLNSNSLFAHAGNYTGEIYFTISNIQNGYFQLINNPNIAITQFTQTQLNNNLVQFVSNNNLMPSYSVSASTGIGNAISSAPQAAQINFVLLAISTRFNATMELSNLNGKNGLTLNGIAVNDYSGCSVASAGDINGDGVADVVIGAHSANPSGRSQAGQSYIVFGKRTAWTSPLELSSLNGANGVILNGIAAYDLSGISVASIGDINGDGVADVVIGANGASPSGRTQVGQSYIVFGKRTAWTSPLELSSLNGANGVIMNGIAAHDLSGISVASAGDINGDGVADLVIGANQASPSGRSAAGQSYIVFGKRASWASPLELSSLNGANGVIVNGIASGDFSSNAVASAGDINGDGVADLVIGANRASPSGRSAAGQSYIVFGKRTAWTSPLELSSLNGANGVILNGIVANDYSGYSVASAGDINGDGVADLAIGAPYADPNGRSAAGQSYIVFGKRTAWTSPLELSSLNGTNSAIMNGIAVNDWSGHSVASAGDINGDGVADVVIGAYFASAGNRTYAGQSYVVFGKRTAWTSPLELSSLNGANGFILNGIAANDQSGYSVASAGDINGDGMADVVISAYGASPSGRAQAGQSYIALGDISIPLINNQLTIAAGQIATLNSNALLAFTGNYTGEVYFNISNIQNGYFQLLNNPGVSIAKFTQTQLNNGLVQLISTTSATPSYSVSASTGIGNAIAPASQAAQIYFNPSATTISTATPTTTYTNASTPVPTTVQVTTTASPTPTTTTVVTTPQGNITITTTPLGTTVTSTSSSVIFTSTSSSSTVATSSSSSVSTTKPTIGSTSSFSTSVTIPTSNGVINITSTTSGQVTVTVPPTMTMTSSQSATSTPNIISTSTVPLSQAGSSVPSTQLASSSSMILTNLTNTTPTTSITTPSPLGLTNATGTPNNSSSNTSLIAGIAGAAIGVTIASTAFFLYRRKKHAQNKVQLEKEKTEIFNIANPIHPTFKASEEPNSLLAESSADGWPAHYHAQNSAWGTEYYTHSKGANNQAVYDLATTSLTNTQSNNDDWPAHYHTQDSAAWGAGYYTHQSVDTNKHQAIYDLASNQYAIPRANNSTYDLADNPYDASTLSSNQNSNFHPQSLAAFFKSVKKPASWDQATYTTGDNTWSKAQYEL